MIVGALKLAADFDCEMEIATYCLVAIEQGRTPDLPELQKQFGRKSAPIPKQSIKQHDLATYDLLIRFEVTTIPDLAKEETYA